MHLKEFLSLKDVKKLITIICLCDKKMNTFVINKSFKQVILKREVFNLLTFFKLDH